MEAAGRALHVVAVQGQPRAGDRQPATRSWEDRESGQKRFKTIVRADKVLFLDTRASRDAAELVAAAVADLSL